MFFDRGLVTYVHAYIPRYGVLCNFSFTYICFLGGRLVTAVGGHVSCRGTLVTAVGGHVSWGDTCNSSGRPCFL